MTSSRTRLTIALSVVLALLGMGLVAGSGPATAAQPKTGHYVYAYKFGPNNSYDGGITFDVSGEPRKVRNFAWQGYSCSTLTISKALTVNGKGKFRYSGNANTAGTTKIPVVLKGKFIRSNKARVSIRDSSEEYSCETLTRVIVKLKN